MALRHIHSHSTVVHSVDFVNCSCSLGHLNGHFTDGQDWAAGVLKVRAGICCFGVADIHFNTSPHAHICPQVLSVRVGATD